MMKHLINFVNLLAPLQSYRTRARLSQMVKNDFQKLVLSAHLTEPRFVLLWSNRKLYLTDKTKNTGFDRHYIYHPAWAARALNQTKPTYHVDISSTLYFCSIVSAFIPVKFYDYRPAELILNNLTSGHIDLTALSWPDNSVLSLSCMHTVEHVGLGRYGDPIDYDGDLKAMRELSRVLAPGGNLLLVVPVGHKARIVFNAHRIYTRDLVLKCFPDLYLHEFTLIPEAESDGGLVENPGNDLLAKQEYGCGCFWFTKKM